MNRQSKIKFFANSWFKPKYFLIGLVLLVLSTFSLAWKAGRVYDFTGFIINMEAGSILDAFKSFGYNQVQPVLQLFNYFLFSFANRNPFLYHLFFIALFGLGVWIWWKLIARIAKNNFAGSSATWFSIFSVLIFITSPYLVEVIVYKVCQAYLLTFVALGTYLYNLDQYVYTGRKRNLIIGVGILFFQLYTFDYVLIYLPITLTYIFFFNKKKFKWRWFVFIVASFLAALLYFLQNQWFLGQWTGHYGDAIHMDMNFASMVKTAANYHLKHFFLGHLFPYSTRLMLYSSQLSNIIAWIIGLIMISIIILRLISNNSFHSSRIFGFSILAGIIVLIPVSNLYFPFLMDSENDRYGMLFQIFVAMSLSYLLFRTKKLRWFKAVLAISFCLFQWYGQLQRIQIWKTNETIISEVLHNIPNDFSDPSLDIYILNLPDNIKGTYLFRSLNSESKILSDTYFSYFGDSLSADIFRVAQMNMKNTSDGVSAEWINPKTLKVSLLQYGTWWWHNGVGASNRKDNNYVFNLDGMSYTIYLSEGFSFENSRFYYWVDNTFTEINYPF